MPSGRRGGDISIKHQRVGKRRLLKLADHDLLLARRHLPMDALQRIPVLIGLRKSLGLDGILHRALHGLHTHIAWCEGQRFHLKGDRQHQKLARGVVGFVLFFEKTKYIADGEAFHTGNHRADMLGGKLIGYLLGTAAKLGQVQYARRGVAGRVHLSLTGAIGSRLLCETETCMATLSPRLTLVLFSPCETRTDFSAMRC